MVHAITAEQQKEFDALLQKLQGALGANYFTTTSDFLTNPLMRYSMAFIFPVEKSRRRDQIRRDVIKALGLQSEQMQSIGSGLYMRDECTVGTFIICITNARRGGRVISFRAMKTA